MLKILLRKTISSLMLMTLALFLVSFSSFDLNENQYNFNNNINNDSYFPNPAMTQSGVTISTESPFAEGGGSYNFNGNSSFMRFGQSSNWNFGTNNYTVEWFQKQAEENSYPRIIQLGNYPSQTFGVSLESQTFYGWTTGPGIALGSLGVFINTWVHFAMVREGTTLRAYKNGVMLGSSTILASQVVGSSSTALTIGNELTQSLGASFEGLITNLRLVSGVAVYSGNDTVNTNFNVPSKNLTAISGSAPNIAAVTSDQTKLLLIPNAPINYSSFTDTILTNDLTISGSNFTPSIFDNQLRILIRRNDISTSVFHKTKFDLDISTKKGFSTYFELNTSSGADGIVFVLTTEVGRGSAGGAMGYLGQQTAFNNSIGFFINPHLGNVNGVYTNKTLFGTTQVFNRPNNMHIFIDYDETSQTLLYEAYSSGDRLLANQIFSRLFTGFNIRTYLGAAGEYFVGFTGGTGAANMEASIAKWTFNNQSILSKTVNLDPRGGTGGSTSITALTGTSMPSASAPTKVGHAFEGYYSEINGGGTKYYNANMSSAINYPLTTDTTLYANWTINPYDITINNNNGDANIVNSYPFGSTMPVIATPEKTGYTFNGWSPALPETVPAINTTYTAQWTAKTNSITLINNNGSDNTTTTATYDSTLSNVSVPIRTGHTFNGYYENEDFTGEPIYSQSGVSTLVWNQLIDINLYAKWTINPYNITINNNLGSIVTTSQNFGTKVSVPATPSATGLTFLGWFKNNDMTLEYDFDEEISSNLNIVAKWGLLENQEIYFNNEFSISDANINFAQGHLILENSNSGNINNSIFIKSNPDIYGINNISVNGRNVYIGLGNSKNKLIGVIDQTLDGSLGKNLRINFPLPVSNFDNGDFSEPSVFTNITTTGSVVSLNDWTYYNKKLDIGNVTTWYSVESTPTSLYNLFNDKPLNVGATSLRDGATFSISREVDSINGVNSNFIVLNLIRGVVDSTTTTAINSSAFGPYIISAPFNLNKSDNIQFYWKALGGNDSFHVLAFLKFQLVPNGKFYTVPLLNKLPRLDLLDKSLSIQEENSKDLRAENILFSEALTKYITKETSLTNDDKLALNDTQIFTNAEFIFSGGSYDDSGGTVLGAKFFVGNIGIQQSITETSVIENLVKNLKLDFQDDNPNLNINNNLTLTLVDSASESSTYSKSINIIPVNDAPIRTGTLNLSATQNQALSINFGQYFTDPDSTLTYSALNLPSNLSLSSSGVLTGTLTNDNVGNNLITITASDGAAPPISAEYTIAVANVNDAPTVNNNVNIPILELEVGPDGNNSLVLPNNMFVDIDLSDTLTYSISNLPASLTFNPGTLTISGKVASNLVFPNDGIVAKIRATDNGSPSLFVERNVVFKKAVPKINYFDLAGNQLDTLIQNPGTQISLSTVAPIGYSVEGWYQEIELVTEFNSTMMPSSILNLYGKFNPIPYSIIYNNLLNGVNNQNNPTIYNITSQINFANPTRVGYDFDGWFADANLNGSPVTSITLGSMGSLNLHAKWTPIVYSINYFDLEVANPNNPRGYTIESPDLLLRTFFNRAGYTFIGFFDNRELKGNSVSRIPAGSTGNISLYAEWIRASYNLTFKDDKGDTISTESIKFGDSIPAAFIPSTDKEGHTFVSWNIPIPSSMPARNLELIAKYKVNQYQLTIKDSLDGIIFSEKFDFDSSLEAIELVAKEIEGYEFEEWSDSLPSTMPANDLEIIANYKELMKYKIIIYGTKDEVLIEKEFREKQQVSDLELPDLSNSSDFNFEKWDKEVPDIMPSENIEIRPIGTKKLSSITLLDINGTIINFIEGQIGTNASYNTPSRIGFTFGGWVNNSNQLVSVNTIPELPVTYTVRWVPKVYTIIVAVASLDYEINVEFGKPLGQLVNAQLFGFRFDGWKNNVTGQFVNSNTIFNSPEEINLVPVFTRLNAAETLIATPGFIIEFIVRILN